MNAFTRSYIQAALWSSTDDNDAPLDHDYSPSDIASATFSKMEADCTAFQSANEALLAESGLSESRAGHCLWLNRNGHGSGFWDEYSQTSCEAYEQEQAIAIGSRDFSKRDALDETCPCPYHVCQRLSKAAKALGEFNLYVGDDGQIHGG